jgi:multidrug efflux pump subunit AcrB
MPTEPMGWPQAFSNIISAALFVFMIVCLFLQRFPWDKE